VHARRLAAVAAGAVVGGALRWLALSATGLDPYLGLLVVNTSASALLGWVAGSIRAGRIRSAELGDLLGAGLCGALSTWSALAVELGEDLIDGRAVRAAAWTVVSVGAGVAAAVAGARLGTPSTDRGTRP
jgi:CrcB protein